MKVVIIPKLEKNKVPLPIILNVAYILVEKEESTEKYILKCKTCDGSLFTFEIPRKIAYKLIGPNPSTKDTKRYYREIMGIGLGTNPGRDAGLLLTSRGVIVDLVHNTVKRID